MRPGISNRILYELRNSQWPKEGCNSTPLLLRGLHSLHPNLLNSPQFLQYSTVDGCDAVFIGRIVHAQILKTSFSGKTFILNRLVDVYGKRGCLNGARQLFDEMSLLKNTFTWNAMITGYAKSGDDSEALHLFHDMPYPDQVSWNAMISGFSRQNCWEEALTFFATMLGEGLAADAFSITSALSSCAGIGALHVGAQIHARVVVGEINWCS